MGGRSAQLCGLREGKALVFREDFTDKVRSEIDILLKSYIGGEIVSSQSSEGLSMGGSRARLGF